MLLDSFLREAVQCPKLASSNLVAARVSPVPSTGRLGFGAHGIFLFQSTWMTMQAPYRSHGALAEHAADADRVHVVPVHRMRISCQLHGNEWPDQVISPAAHA